MSIIKIALSDRRPVDINTEQWPVIAKASWFSGAIECQANETAYVKVRRRESRSPDVLVYGVRDRGDGGMPAGYRGRAAGYLLKCRVGEEVSDDDIVRAVRRVAGVLDMDGLAAECLADLPSEAL